MGLPPNALLLPAQEELDLKFISVDSIKRFSLSRGAYWFSDDTLRMFGTRLSDTVYGGRFFVSSERNFDNTARFYTVRFVRSDGGVETVGEFQEHATAARARAAARVAARKWIDDVTQSATMAR